MSDDFDLDAYRAETFSEVRAITVSMNADPFSRPVLIKLSLGGGTSTEMSINQGEASLLRDALIEFLNASDGEG
jgi:hypothetical protein